MACAHTSLTRRRSPAGARPLPLARGRFCWLYAVMHSSSCTRFCKYTGCCVLILRSALRCTNDIPLPVCHYFEVLSCSPAAARPPPLLLVVHGYTQQHYQLLLILYLTWLLCVSTLRSALRCTYDIPLPVCITFLLARRRSPAAALVGCTQQYTQYVFVGTLESVGKKHEIAQFKAQLQAQVKVAILSRKHKNQMFK